MATPAMKERLPEKQRATRIVSAVKLASAKLGRSMTQVAIAWLRYRTVPVIPIIGARKLSQLQDNLASLERLYHRVR
jgi:aryl-alcohol dehydrogenase-like predicted oxidoreductase